MKNEYRVERNKQGLCPMGVTPAAGGIQVSFVSSADKCALLLYKKGAGALKARIPFPAGGRMGDVWSMKVFGDFKDLEYTFEQDGQETADPYGRCFSGRDRWGQKAPEGKVPRAGIISGEEAFDWENDSLPCIDFSDSIIYRIHTRGFTRHPSSGVEAKARGTFAAVAEKIPYMKELGITTVEMLPPVEFDEVMVSSKWEPYGQEKPEEKINYWGYGPAKHFAPKAAYSCGPVKNPPKEFKELVKALHREGMELIIELYFDGTEAPGYVLDAVRFWAGEYHVDGVHFVGYAPLELLEKDPYLRRLKLFAQSWPEEKAEKKAGNMRRLADYNESFMLDMRGFLKGDEGKLNSVSWHFRHNPDSRGTVNYLANTNGFTLMDMVSYDKKHNQDNGEENRDGTDYNQSWNCGAEGPTRKKKVLAMRRKQLRNAFLLLMLSQGTPLLMAGDEFGRTKKGNNNSYCQDNEISWLNWGLLKTNHDLDEFAKYAISFRKAHSVFHMDREPALLDYRSVGLPDMSYHGVKAWCPDFDSLRRQIGIFYCGKYGKKADGGDDDYFYAACNMHWEPQEFALPNLPKGMKWHVAFNTDDEAAGGFYQPGAEPLAKEQKTAMVMARTIVVFIGKAENMKKENEYHAE